MSQTNDFLEWVSQAEGDLKMAHSGLRRKEPILFATCFHAQQCAEKYLKALLVFKKAEFPKIHDLLQLARLCEKHGVILPVDENLLDKLSEYAVLKRYPSESPTTDEAVEAIQAARAVRKFARKFLGIK